MSEVIDILKMLWPLLLLQILILLWAIIDLIKRSNVRHLPKWAWILIVIFINLFGPIAYLVFGRGEE